jgi:hypothetical protein
MPRLAVFAFTIASLTTFAAGVVDAVPLVFWGSDVERAAVDHGRTVMLVGMGSTLAAAAAIASVGGRRFAALVAAVPLAPAGLVLAADGTALGLFALWPALCVGFWAAFMACVPAGARARLGPSIALGLFLPPLIAAAGAISAGIAATAVILFTYAVVRAGGSAPSRAVVAVAPAAGYALVTATAVFAGATLLT